MRFAAYAGASTVLATGVIVRAVHQRANFYSACVYLSQSNACLMILTNLVLLCVGSVMLGLQKLLYGPLRPIEVEQLYEKAWFAITETCLAMTIFREEVGAWFIVMFVSLLIGKVWGWIGEGRVEILEQQPPANPRLFHARLSVSLVSSILFETYMLNYSVQTVRQQARPTMMVMFAFEFAVLIVTSMSTFARYAISVHEAAVIKSQTRSRLQEQRNRMEQGRIQASEEGSQSPVPLEEELDELDIDVPGWEEKGRWIFYLDLTTDFFKLILYLTFFCVLCKFYGMPIHIVRDVALTMRSFYKRITDFMKYRHATKDMNERYPDAEASEIGQEDVCIICREGMTAWSTESRQSNPPADGARPTDGLARTTDERHRPKKLPCGHILHFACLRSWLERQQNCPTCRRPVIPSNTTTRTTNPQNPDRQIVEPAQANVLGGVAGAPAINNPVARNGGNRVRVFNLGPIRLGFGAGPDMQGLAQQLNNQPALQHHQQDPAPGGGVAEQFGFGIRFGRQPQITHQQPGIMQTNPGAIQGQLQVIEQQLMHEINGLRSQVDQLVLVRALQGELARLRIAQATSGSTPMVATSSNSQSRSFPFGLPNFVPHALPEQLPTVQAFGADQHQTRLGAGHQALPPGVVIPDGWSLMPLQRLPNGTNSVQATGPVMQASSTAESSSRNPTLQPTVQASSRSAADIDHHRNPEPSAATTTESATHVIRTEVDADPGAIRAARGAGSVDESGEDQHNRDRGNSHDAPAPAWGSASSKPTSLVPGDEASSPPATSSREAEGLGEETTFSAEARTDKGKGRATTVEDAADEVE